MMNDIQYLDQDTPECVRHVTKEEEELFDEKKRLMRSVFDRVLKTDKGKFFVRQHEDDYDAQEVFEKLMDHCTSSAKAALEASKLLS